LREIKSKFSDRLGIAWAVVSPVIFIFALSFARGAIDNGVTHSIPTFFFMMYGMILVQFLMGLIASLSSAIQKNKQLFAFRQVQPISSILAVAGFELLAKAFVIVTLALICYILQLKIEISDPIGILSNVIKVFIISTSIGMLIALMSCYVPEIQKLQALAMRPIFFISGIFFSLQDIPQEYWHYLTWNPLLHAVELTRYAAYPSYGNVGVSELYLNMFTICSAFFALACYHISWKQAISR